MLALDSQAGRIEFCRVRFITTGIYGKMEGVMAGLLETEVERLRRTLSAELVQRGEEGCDIGHFVDHFERFPIETLEESEIHKYLLQISELPTREDFMFDEPSDLESIRTARPDSHPVPATNDGEYGDRLRGAWLGRCAGCCLGKPVELWARAEIRSLLDGAGIEDLREYLPYLDPSPAGRAYHRSAMSATRGHIDGMPRDDDIDYMILALNVLEAHGPDVSTSDFGLAWLDSLPINKVFTAERAAYLNMMKGVPIRDVPHFENPYREWIGAQIRADVLGYVLPGRPESAAELAFRDASISHVKNGIYGEMWAAATIAAAFGVDDPITAIRIGLNQIPAESRLYVALTQTLEWCQELDAWTDVAQRIDDAFYKYHPVHTINNACYVVLSLAHGNGDFARTVGIAVECGADTDCNGATAGSILGATLGADAIPEAWVLPFHDRVKTDVAGMGDLRISDLIDRTMGLGQGAFASVE